LAADPDILEVLQRGPLVVEEATYLGIAGFHEKKGVAAITRFTLGALQV